MNVRRLLGTAASLALLCSVASSGDVAYSIVIGDIDGFGLDDGSGHLNFNGDPVNVDGLGVLTLGDFLPDWDQDGLVRHFRGDDYDLRSVDEISGSAVSLVNFVNRTSTGSQFTDLSLSASFDTEFPPPNAFPDPPSIDRNDSHFVFDFEIDVDNISSCLPMFFNVVFGDVGGASPSEVRLRFADGSEHVETIDPIDPDVKDGQINGAFVELAFDDVFTLDGDVWHGFVEVDFATIPSTKVGDPYYAVDFAELSTVELTSCAQDVDLDGIVGTPDLLQLLAAWGNCNGGCGCPEDIDGDGEVRTEDILQVLAFWGPC